MRAKKPRNTCLAKVDLTLLEWSRKIAAQRVVNGRDKKYSPTRVQRKLIKHPFMPQVSNDLINWEFKDE